jgi:hypothetical protein
MQLKPTFTSTAFILISFLFLHHVPAFGQIKKEERNVAAFNQLEINGAFTVVLTQGNKPAFSLKADQKIIPDIRHEVKAGKLKVWHTGSWKKNKDVTLYITVDNLTEIELSGAISLESANTLRSGSIDLDLSGACSGDLDMVVGELDMDVSGACSIDLKGSAKQAEIEVSGAVSLDAVAFKVQSMDIDLSGAGSARVFVTGQLKAEVSGTGSISYKGDPVVEKSVSGFGSIKPL